MTAREVSLFRNASLAAKNLKQRLLANVCSSPRIRVLGQQSCRHWLNLFRRFRLPFIPPLTNDYRLRQISVLDRDAAGQYRGRTFY